LAKVPLIITSWRTPKEFAEGHLAGAQNVDFNGPGFKEALAALDRETPYLVHCGAGGRSSFLLEL
jgi:rhodanese-related sulfurtransferase